MFYIGNSPVKIYQFDSSEAIKQALDSNAFMKNWPANGLFLIDSKVGEVNELFIKIYIRINTLACYNNIPRGMAYLTAQCVFVYP